MSSSALPPLAGVSSGGSRDDREEQRTQKVKPLPLMLSSRAPLVQAAGSVGSPSHPTTRGRAPASQPSSQPPATPQHLHPAVAAASDPPVSPSSSPSNSNRSSSKLTRLRGFQVTPPQQPVLGVGLENSSVLQSASGPQLPGGRLGSQLPSPLGPLLDGAAHHQHHHSWDGGEGSQALATSPTRIISGGRLGTGGGGGSGGGSGGGGGGASQLDVWQQSNGSSSGGGGGPSVAWAARRNALLAERGGPTGGGAAQLPNPQSRGRDVSAFEGAAAAGLILGPSGGPVSLAAVGSVPLAMRAPNASGAPKHMAALLLPHSGGGGRPDSAPSTPAPAPAPPLDPLAATFPHTRTHTHVPSTGLVPPAPINPPLQPPAWPAPDGSGAGGASYPLPYSSSDDAGQLGSSSGGGVGPAADAGGLSDGGLHQRHLTPQPSNSHSLAGAQGSLQPQPSTTQLLHRLFRTNRTPPSQTESLQELFSGGGGGGGVAGGGTSPSPQSASGADSPNPLPPSSSAALPQPPSQSTGGGSPVAPATALVPPLPSVRSGGGGGGAIVTSLSGLAAASRPGTTGTFASSSLPGSLLSRPRGRGAAAGTLADLSAALQKSIAAGMGEWDLRADGTWGHPEIQQRLLKGPLSPEALKNRYRMEERDIISLYRLLYSYSIGFFTDVESLLDVAVSDRSSGASVGLGVGTSLRKELLENVFRAYATLWDEALMIVFDSEMAAMLADKNAALRALDRGAAEMEALRREKHELAARLEDFVKQNVDNVLASRHLQQAATRLEGEVHSLHNANEQLVTHMARHAVEVATLERQLDAARAATTAAESRAAAAEAHLSDLKAIVSDQNTTLSAQFFQIKELERMCGELQETVRNLNRRRAAVLGLLTGNTPEPSDAGLAAAAAAATSSPIAGTSQRGTGNGTGPDASPAAAASSPAPAPATAPSPAAAPAGLAGTSFRAAGTASGTTSGAGSARARPGTADGGIAPPSTPPAAPAAALPPLDSATEGVLADVSLLDPEELGRLLSDKTRAFNLMHADFVVKMHELDDQRAVNESLRGDIEAMKAEVKKTEDAAAASDRTADKFRAKYETSRMAMEDLEEKNRKLTHKNAELVRSYWPLMTRLKEAEEEAARCREQAARDRQQAEADRAEADLLRAAAADTRIALQELEERRAEAASHELELPPDVLAHLPEGQVLALRRFTRSCHRRVAHLNAQVVALVDQVTQMRLQEILHKEHQLMHGTGGEGGGSGGGGGGGGSGAAAESDVSSALVEARQLRSAVASRDKWIAILVKAMTGLMGQMENLMARDWETCRTLRLEQQQRKRLAARAARRAARAAAGGAGGSGSGGTESGSVAASASLSTMPSSMQVGNSELPASVSGAAEVLAGGASGSVNGGPSAESSAAVLPDAARSGSTSTPSSPFCQGSGEAAAATALAAAEPSATSLSSVPDGGSTAGGAAADGQPSQPQEEQGDGGGGGDDGDNDDVGDDGGDDTLTVAAGRLAQMLGISKDADGVERSGALVSLDRTFDRLADSAERLMEWSQGLLRRKEQTANFGQMRQKLDSTTRQLDAATLELNSLRPLAEGLRHSVRSYEIKLKEMTTTVASCKQRAETAESRLESVEAQLAVVTAQLREAQDAQKLLEEEYWKAKDVALEAEVTTGELKAGRIRALEAAAKAVSAVSGLEKEARENRDQRVALQADLVGYKAWVRHMEAIERKHRETLKELADATGGCEERDRKLAELKERIATLEQQLRFKSIEASSLESRVKALSGELVEERRAARIAVAAARGASAVQLDTAIRQAGAAEAEAAARAERVAVLEGRLAEATSLLDAAQDTAAAAQGRLVPLTHERDRLRAHLAASQSLLQTMSRAAESIDRRLALLENAAAAATPPPALAAAAAGAARDTHVRFGVPVGSLESVLGALLDKVDEALDACTAVAAEAAGDETPALLGALEGLVVQLLSTLTKGGKEPIQSLAVLKAQLARDDKELAAARATLLEVRIAGDAAARDATEQRAAAAAAAKAAAAATAAAARDSRRAAAAESALMASRRDLDSAVQQLSEARLLAETAKRQSERATKRAAELEADLASAHSQRRHYEAQAAAAQAKCVELKRRSDALEVEGQRDQDAAREATERAAAAEAAAAAAELRCSELEAAVEAERREAARLRTDAQAAVATAAQLRERAVTAEQQMLETQAKFADIIRHDESVEERLRQAQFEANNMRRKAEEAMAEAAEATAQYEALQQRAWQLQVALQAKHGEKEEVLRELVDVTHGAAARKVAAAAAGSASVKQRAEGTHETASSFKTKRTEAS